MGGSWTVLHVNAQALQVNLVDEVLNQQVQVAVDELHPEDVGPNREEPG